MSEDVLNPDYWENRLATTKTLHQSVFLNSTEEWRRIEDKHRKILARHIKRKTSILDLGCGYGRLLSLLPRYWNGKYLGIDICPAFIDLARRAYRGRKFKVRNMEDLSGIVEFDLGILISVRPMLIRNIGGEYWDKVHEGIRKVAHNLLYLEYDYTDEGELE